MRPRWHFILGSLSLLGGLISLTVLAIFLISLMTFSLRTHGPMGAFRYQQLLSSFPWWAVAVMILGLGLGFWILKKYDFSYQKNFLLIAGGVIVAILLAGWLVDYMNWDNLWMRQGPMKKLYQQYDGGMMRGRRWQMMQNSNQDNSSWPRNRWPQ